MSEVIWAVRLPLPISGWCMKEKVSTTVPRQVQPEREGLCWRCRLGRRLTPWCKRRSVVAIPPTQKATISTAATPNVITQARTLRNLVNSARSSWANPSRPTGISER